MSERQPPRYGRMPELAGGKEVAQMLGVTRPRASQLLDRRTHPAAPVGQRLAGGTFYLKSDIVAYARWLGREIREEDAR